MKNDDGEKSLQTNILVKITFLLFAFMNERKESRMEKADAFYS